MRPAFEDEGYPSVDSYRLLLCPRCQGFNLHHGGVRVWNREEDRDIGTYAEIDFGAAAVAIGAKLPPGNPSGRRHGLKIDFECEGCGSGLALCIAQHKGDTQVEWEVGPDTSGIDEEDDDAVMNAAPALPSVELGIAWRPRP